MTPAAAIERIADIVGIIGSEADIVAAVERIVAERDRLADVQAALLRGPSGATAGECETTQPMRAVPASEKER